MRYSGLARDHAGRRSACTGLRSSVRSATGKAQTSRRNGPWRPVFDSPNSRRCPEPCHERGCARHIPVLGREAVEMLAPRDGGIYIDATFGAGGYQPGASSLPTGPASSASTATARAIAGGFDLVEQSDGRLTLVEDGSPISPRSAPRRASHAVDGVVLDVGVSSMQLDQAERGFSFRLDGPLDMRMGQRRPERRRCRRAAPTSPISPTSSTSSARSAIRARVARAIVARAQGSADRDHARAGRHRRQGGAGQAGRNPSGDAHVPGAAHFRQRRTRRTASWRWPPPSAC